MAAANKKQSKGEATPSSSQGVKTTVRVIKDTSVDKPKKVIASKKAVATIAPVKKDKPTKEKHGNYFVGAWRELRQVKWPNRRTTWGLTISVIVFTIVLMLFIVGIDLLFDLLFKRIIG